MTQLTTRHILTALTLTLVCVSCVTVPLSRSYDDPYNTPLPNETAPPSVQGQQEQCTRDPLSCEVDCVKDKDCQEDEICYKGTCIIKDEPESTLNPPLNNTK